MSRLHKGLNKRAWEYARLQVLRRANFRCRKCRGYGNEVDHIKPLQKGGAKFDPANLDVLCSECHRTKTSTENRGRELSQAEVAWADLVNHT